MTNNKQKISHFYISYLLILMMYFINLPIFATNIDPLETESNKLVAVKDFEIDLKVEMKKITSLIHQYNQNEADSSSFSLFRHTLTLFNQEMGKNREFYLFIDVIEGERYGEAIFNKDVKIMFQNPYPGGKGIDFQPKKPIANPSISWEKRHQDTLLYQDTLNYRKSFDLAVEKLTKSKTQEPIFFSYKINDIDSTYSYIQQVQIKNIGKCMVGISSTKSHLFLMLLNNRQNDNKSKQRWMFAAIGLFFLVIIVLLWYYRKLTKFQTALDQAENGILLMNLDGEIDWANEKIKERYGNAENLFQVTNISPNLLKIKIEEAKNGHVKVYYASEKDGQYYQTRLSYVESLEKIIAIDMNTTEMELGREIIDNSPNGLAVLNEQGQYEYMNKTMKSFYQKMGKEVNLNESLYELSQNKEGFKVAFEKCKMLGTTEFYVSEFENRHYQTALTKVNMQGIAKYILVDTDITALLEERGLTQGFVITLAHRIKNEINPYIDAVNLTTNEPKLTEKGTKIRERLERLKNLNKQENQIFQEKIQLASFLRHLAQNYQELAVKIQIEIDESVEILGDKDILSSVILDIWDNAIKYKANNINILCEKESQFYSLKISNNGLPISLNVKPLLFKQQINSSGWGIALLMAKRNLARFQTEIGLLEDDSTKNEVCFYLKIPIPEA